MAKLNTKGKPKWTATIKQMNQQLFHNLPNEEINLAELVKETTLKEDIMERFKTSDEIITCGSCHKESKISRNKFLLETLDAKTKCSGCNKSLPVKMWHCACYKPWYQCEKHCKAGKVFRRLNANKAKQKKEDEELGRDPKFMQKQIKRELNALQKGEEPSANNKTETVTMRPKYNDVLSVGVNPNFLSPSLKRRFGFED